MTSPATCDMWDAFREKAPIDRVAVRKEILRLSLPIAITSLAQNVYHLIDSFFLSALGEEDESHVISACTVP